MQSFGEEDFARLERIRWCPVQFQAFVEGTDIRVHTIGDDAFATRITSDAIDYRSRKPPNPVSAAASPAQ